MILQINQQIWSQAVFFFFYPFELYIVSIRDFDPFELYIVAKCLHGFDLGCVAWKKCQNFLG